MKKALSLLALLAGSVTLLSGCEEGNSGHPIEIKSLYDGMVALYQTKNYTLDVIHVMGGYRDEIPSMIFTENYIGYDGVSYEELDVLYNDGTGIYRVSFGDDFRSGEYLVDANGNKETALWNNTNVIKTMYGQSGAYIKKYVQPGINEIRIEDKDYKLKFLETITGYTTNYASIDYLDAKFENNKVTFNLSLNNQVDTYKVTLKDVGSTSSKHLNMFVKNGGKAFEPSKDLSEMRRLISKNNFVQRTYSFSDGIGFWSGFQFFTEHYFFTTGSDSNVGYAYVEFDYKDDPALDNDFDMWGIYLVNVFKNEAGEIDAALTSANAYNSSTKEIEECCRYPSIRLDLFQNLEFVKQGEVRDAQYQMSETEANRYYFVDANLVNNFVDNFSLNTQFEDVSFNTIAIEIQTAEQDKDAMVCFHAIGYYAGDGLTYDIIIPLYGFGDANRKALDIIYETYNK